MSVEEMSFSQIGTKSLPPPRKLSTTWEPEDVRSVINTTNSNKRLKFVTITHNKNSRDTNIAESPKRAPNPLSMSLPLNNDDFGLPIDPETRIMMNKLNMDHEQHKRQKQHEIEIQEEINQSQQKMIENLLQKEQSYLLQIQELKDSHDRVLHEKDIYYDMKLTEKQKEIQDLLNRMQTISLQSQQKSKEMQQEYLTQLSRQEEVHKIQLHDERNQYQIHLNTIQEQLSSQEANHKIILDAHEKAFDEKYSKKYNKKLAKYEKEIEKIIQHYKEKEYRFDGSIEELRKENLQIKTYFELKEKEYSDELRIKDKKILFLEKENNEIDDLIHTAKNWKALASDLSNLLIHTCSTAEDLPKELWSKTTPGLFASIYDEFHGITERSLKDNEYTYEQKKREYVIVKKLLLSKCLKLSKVSYYLPIYGLVLNVISSESSFAHSRYMKELKRKRLQKE
jgi:hypothetical protein